MRTEIIQRWQPKAGAESYEAERFHGILGRAFHQAQCRALRHIARLIPAGSQVADVPCGTGRMHPVLRDQGLRIVGCDISEAMLRKAAHQATGNRDARLVIGDATRLPFEDRSLDGVFSIRFFMHLASQERQAVLCEFARVSRRLIVVEYGRDSGWHKWRRAVRKVGMRLLGRNRTYPASTPVDQIHGEAQVAGLRICGWRWTLRGLSESVFVVMEKKDSQEATVDV